MNPTPVLTHSTQEAPHKAAADAGCAVHVVPPTEVIDRAVAAGDIDIGVHSLKDSPVNLPDGVKLAACLPRDDARDAFISLKATSLGE